MTRGSTVGRGGAVLAAAVWVALGLLAEVRGQSVGFGASPGRAAYRPQWQWNNGPYYTADHWNPYSPHTGRFNDLVESDPVLPPWTTGPHGRFSAYTPARGTLYQYAEGFSPYSGYAGWYEQTYRFRPTRDDVIRGRVMFFRSAPIPPASALPPLPPAVAAVAPIAAPRVVTPLPRVVAPAARGEALPAVPVYRSSVTGS